MNQEQLRKAEHAYRRDFDCPPSRREREKALQADFSKVSGPASGSVGYGLYNIATKKWAAVFGNRLEFTSAAKAYAWRVKLTKGKRDEATNTLRTILQVRPLNTDYLERVSG